jgi:hypothetical protein
VKYEEKLNIDGDSYDSGDVRAKSLDYYSTRELVGESVEIFIPERHRHTHVQDRQAYMAAARSRPMAAGLSLYARRPDGTSFQSTSA